MFLKGECADFPDSWSDRMWGPDDLPNQRTQYELRRAADQIESLTDVGGNAVVERAGMERDKVLELMHEETWLTPEAALELGIATAITQESGSGPAQSARREIMQRLTQPREEKKTPTPKPGKSIMEMLAGVFND